MKIFFFAAAIIIFDFSVVRSQKCVDEAKVVPPALSAQARKTYETKLDEARTQSEKTPGDPDAIIWLGRRMAYIGEYKSAIKIFTDGATKFPKDARMYRHRGHRYITLRCFDAAIRDFEVASKLTFGTADQIEPDGLPNAKNIPTGTLQTNIYYHLGLAYYLKGEYSRAAGAFMNSFNRAKNPDMQVAAAHWVYMSVRRYGDQKKLNWLLRTHFKNDLEIIENQDYYTLVKLYLGKVKADDLLKNIGGEANSLGSASLGYGLGNWYLYNGDKTKATEIFRRITAGDQWASFGYIAAEAELK